MPANPTAGVQPRLLRWARESANIPVAEVAAKLKRSVAEIEAWERGDSAPSYAQLEKLAYSLYKRPLALFFLPEPPDEPTAKAEFRSLPDHDLDALNRDTLLLIRKARAYQYALAEFYGDRTPAERPIWRTITLSYSDPAQRQAERVREALGISIDQQTRWGDAEIALRQWRRSIEASGVFVFKNTFKQREISGFCLIHDEFPIVMINNSTTKTRQIFSLAHELAHVLCRRNAISSFDETRLQALRPSDRAIETFCNAVASFILVPSDDFQSKLRVLPRNLDGSDDEVFGNLADHYCVSRAVILRRMLEEGRVSQRFYSSKSEEWDSQRIKKDSGGDYYNTQNAYLSERFLRDVFLMYARRQISRDDAADLVGVAPKNLDKLEDRVLRGTAA